MPLRIKKVWNVVTTVLVVLLVVVVILLVGVRLIGIKPYTVLSGSMEPKYPVGSLIYVMKVDPLSLEVDDPVTFMLNANTVATHRIIEVIPDDEDPTVVRFRTKGDNNNEADGNPLHSSNVIGKPIFCIPGLGYVANYVQNPPGKYIALGTCMVLLVSVMLSVFMQGDDEKKPSKKDAAQTSGNDLEGDTNKSAENNGDNTDVHQN